MALSADALQRIDGIFEAAHADKRSTLHEFEVYSLLEAAGLVAPRHVFLRDPTDVTESLLSRFAGGSLILKTVSRDLAHSQRYGGVKHVAGTDPLFVRFVMNNMREEVLSHFTEDGKPAIDGFLLVEFVRFTQALGNEIMIGMQDDHSFGPVLTLTKGGDDAEFFAKYYDPANLVLAPVSYPDAQKLTHSLKIRHKFEAAGHPEYLDMMARAVTIVSEIGYAYSSLARRRPKWLLNVLDLNPLVFSEDGRFVAVDGYAEFSAQGPGKPALRAASPAGLKGFFEPDGIAVLGVSSDASKYSMARVIATLLCELGRRDVYCVNPKGGETELDGIKYPLYRSLEEIPFRCDLAVYAAPAQHTLDFIRSLPEGKQAIIISGIPADTKYAEFAESVTICKPKGSRIIGPNCMGVFYAPGGGNPGVDTLFIDESRLHVAWGENSNCALFTQSGAMGVTSIERAQYSRIFRTIVSFGNKVDVNVPDLIAYFENDPKIDVMAMYMEGVNPGEGRQFYDAAQKSKKPILVYKSGRTEAGMKAAISHTASMSGSYDTFSAACVQAGCVLLEELDDFYNSMKAFSMLHRKRPSGRRVAGVVNAGLDATMGADLLNCLHQAALQPETVQDLKRLNVHGLVDVATSFLDLTPMTGDILYVKFIEAVLDDPGVDCLFVAIVPHIENLKTLQGNYLEADAIAPLLVSACKKRSKPVVVSVNAGQHYQYMVQYLEENGLPVYADIRSAVRSLDTFAGYWTKELEST
jgi:3-hydroxypropionyl-CoA synthetase (ADP-forming)